MQRLTHGGGGLSRPSSRRHRTAWLATLDNALSWHSKFTLFQRTTSQLIADIWRVVREWRIYFEEFGVDAAEMNKVAPAFRHIDEISTPELRKLLP